MELITVKTNELFGLALDWAVAQVDGALDGIPWVYDNAECYYSHDDTADGYSEVWKPSKEWEQAGVLIERHGIGVAKFYEPVDGAVTDGNWWAALSPDDAIRCDAPTPLVAAMRVIVAMQFGESIDVPSKLIGVQAGMQS